MVIVPLFFVNTCVYFFSIQLVGLVLKRILVRACNAKSLFRPHVGILREKVEIGIKPSGIPDVRKQSVVVVILKRK